MISRKSLLTAGGGFFWMIVCLVAAFCILGCGSGGTADGSTSNDTTQVAQNEGDEAGDDGESAEPETKKPRERTTSVQVSEALRGDLVIPVIAEGTIRARHEAEIRTEMAGKILKIHVVEGQTVRKGALIAKLDDREYEVALEEARSKYLQAVSLLAIEDESFDVPERTPDLQAQIEQLKKLESEGAITHEERLAREIALDVEAVKEGHFRLELLAGRSGIAESRAAMERARLDLERTEIRAPFSGVVAGLELDDGEQVTVNQTVCTLVDNQDIEAQVGILESDIGKVDIGRPALLIIPALGDTTAGRIDVVSPQFDRTSRTCDVLLRLRNDSGRLRPGMFVRAIIAGERLEDRLLVPREAIITRDGRPLLFKIEEDRAKWLYIQLGQENDHLVEVKAVLQGGELQAGDRVVVADHLTLAHDAKVKVKKIVPIHDPWGAAR